MIIFLILPLVYIRIYFKSIRINCMDLNDIRKNKLDCKSLLKAFSNKKSFVV